MKKIILLIIFLVPLLNIEVARAETFCAGVNFPADYDACCVKKISYLTNKKACNTYTAQQSQNSAPTNTSSYSQYCSSISSDDQWRQCCSNKDGYFQQCDDYIKNNPADSPATETFDICQNTKFNSLVDIINWLKCFLKNGVIPIIFVAIVLFFTVSVFRYVSEKDSKKQEEMKKTILWGLVGLFVAVSVWGIVEIVSQVLGFGNANVMPLLQEKPYVRK